MTVDTAAPAAPVITSFSTDSGTAGDGITNDNTLTLTGTAEANSTVKVYDGATLLGTATANGSGAWSFTTAAWRTAAHSFTATATDAAGNTGAASAALSVTIDTAAPAAPAIASCSTDTGTAGDGITSDNTLDPDRHRRGQQHREGLRRRDAARHGDGQRQRRLELHHGRAGGWRRTASRRPRPMRPATPARPRARSA